MLVMMYGWAIIEETLIPGVTAVWIQKSQNFGDLGNCTNKSGFNLFRKEFWGIFRTTF